MTSLFTALLLALSVAAPAHIAIPMDIYNFDGDLGGRMRPRPTPGSTTGVPDFTSPASADPWPASPSPSPEPARAVPAALSPSAAPALLSPSAGVLEGAPITIHGRAGNLLGRADSASAGSVSQEDLSHRPLLRPAEVLEAVPGLLITQHSGDGKANQYFTRGFNLDHGTDLAFSLEGVPVNEPSNAHGEGYADLNFLIPDLIKQVDYSKGPFNAEVGDYSTAGSVDFSYPLTLKQGLASLTLGQYGYQRGLMADSLPLAGGDILFALEASSYDGPWAVPEDNKKLNGLLRYSRGDYASRWVLTASSYAASWNATNQTPERAVSEGIIPAFGSLDPTDGGNTWRNSLWASWSGDFAGGRAQALAYAADAHLQLWNDFTFFLNHPSQGDQFEQEDDRAIIGGKASWVLPWQAGGLKGANELGLEARNDNITTLGLFNTEARAQWGPPVSLDHGIETSGAPHAQSSVQWAPWLRSQLGYRQDFYHFDVMGLASATSGAADASLPEPKAGLSLRPWEGPLELYLNYGWSFHTNDERIITPSSLSGLADGQATRSPLIQAKGEELGLRYAQAGVYEGTLALWSLHLDSELTFDGDAGASAVNGPSTREGVEWSNTFRWAPFFLDLDYAYSQARFDTLNAQDPAHAGFYVPEAIEQVGTATLGLSKVLGFSADARLRYFGSRALTADDAVRSPASTLVSLRLSHPLTSATTLSLDAFNLFDEQAYDVSYYYISRLKGEPSAGVAGINGHPTEPRSLRLTLAARF